MRIAVYESRNGHAPFEEWFQKLGAVPKRAVQRRLRAIEEHGHFGNRKNLRGGLHEIKFGQPIRIYFTESAGEVVVLLGGSGKRDQKHEIEKARIRLNDFRQRIDRGRNGS